MADEVHALVMLAAGVVLILWNATTGFPKWVVEALSELFPKNP